MFQKLYPAALLVFPLLHAADPTRPVNFVDIVSLKTTAALDVSPDGKSALYELREPDWKSGRTFTDICLVSTSHGVKSTRRLTNTRDKNETAPRWAPSGHFFFFLSDRDDATNGQQIFRMKSDGSDARRLTNAAGGTGSFDITGDGRYLLYSASTGGARQLWMLPIDSVDSAKAIQLTRQPAGTEAWAPSRDGKRVYFSSPDLYDTGDSYRRAKGFSVTLRNQPGPPSHLYSVDVATQQLTQWTKDGLSTVSDISIAPNSDWVGFKLAPNNRYTRTGGETNDVADLYLLHVSTSTIERLTNNPDIGESRVFFSTDSRVLAFSAAEEFAFNRRQRAYVRSVSGGELRQLGNGFDGDIDISFWSPDGRSLYFTDGAGATEQLFTVSIASGQVEQLTRVRGSISASRDRDSGRIIVQYQDPTQSTDYYLLKSIEDAGSAKAWVRLTDANPQIANWNLGKVETTYWKSPDGARVEGVIVYPPDFKPNRRYPLIVQLHGGPAAASLLAFNATPNTYSQVWAGSGYVCLLPNYRGSTNYGEQFRREIEGDYFQKGYEDIMSGVDALIARGIADPARMAVMGWSAGGHWSNWILTHTSRFKAISTGAGVMNWISMYAQNDIQRLREQYLGGLPYDKFDDYLRMSPIRYVRNAKTPTLIHVVDGDPRVPRPQSEELYMALRKLNVPTEFLIYPGTSHGIGDIRNQVLKMVAEFRWIDKWVNQRDNWIDWKELAAMVPAPNEPSGDSRH